MEKLLKEAVSLVKASWDDQRFDHLAFACLDFSKNHFEKFEVIEGELHRPEDTYFDLASLTKPLTLAAYFHLFPKKMTPEKRLLLEHRAGLPAWSVLSKVGWEEYINSFEVRESDTLYSDLSALRLMLEIEREEKSKLEYLCSSYWDDELVFWQNLSLEMRLPYNGWRSQKRILDQVNDDNCYRLNRFCSHAGLFSTIGGLSRTLLNLNNQSGFVGEMKRDHDHRFDRGWDTVEKEVSLAGVGASKFSFGHLGFTGTCIWIDPEKNIGWILLTNTVKDYWYEKRELNELRRALGGLVWAGFA